jgi:uncharacterized protein (DUF2384 family)
MWVVLWNAQSELTMHREIDGLAHNLSNPHGLFLVPSIDVSKFTAVSNDMFVLPKIKILLALAQETEPLLVAAVGIPRRSFECRTQTLAQRRESQQRSRRVAISNGGHS